MKTMDKMIELQKQWHEERNLIKGTDNQVQSKKFLEEYLEWRAALEPETKPDMLVSRIYAEMVNLLMNGRIKQFSFKEARKERIDAIGDMCNMLTGFAEREGVSRLECSKAAYREYSKRKGKMVNGIWTKEDDL